MSHAPSFLTAPPRLDPMARLLLLASKVNLSPPQRQEARALAAQVSDWETLFQIAARKFVAPLLHRHLQVAASDVVPPPALERLRQLSRSSAMSTLRVAAAHIAFHKACIEPTGARHVYVKGCALAAAYYAGLGDRFCRDIDVLVSPQDFGAVLDAAIAAGYRACFDLDPYRPLESGRDRAFALRYEDVITLVGPDSVSIELHRRLDKRGLNFDLGLAFATARTVAVSGVPVRTLATAYHFNYVCYHHSRHFWSHLHWLADIDAMIAAPDFERRDVERMAGAIGIRPTIDAAIEFHELVSRSGLWRDEVPLTGGGQFLRACLFNLEGGIDLEKELRHGKLFKDFMSAWQASPSHMPLFALKSLARRLRPKAWQYVENPYPAPIFWLYALENVWRDIARGLASLLTLPVRSQRRVLYSLHRWASAGCAAIGSHSSELGAC
jgi:hypothetical protein